VYVPLKDVVRLHNGQEVRGILKFEPSGNCYFENAALNYLCRSKILEDLSLLDFTEGYYTVRVPRSKSKKRKRPGSSVDDEVFPYMAETSMFKHPSVVGSGKNKGQCAQGSKLRDDIRLGRVSQWMFPDTAEFKADMFTCSRSEFNHSMEKYAQLVLALCLPHRSRDDLVTVGENEYPYLMKLRQVKVEDELRQQAMAKPTVFTDRSCTFLQP